MVALFRSLKFRLFEFVSDLSAVAASAKADLEFRISDFSLSFAFGGNFNQSKANDYAKQTQFFKKSNVYNLNNNN
jgi:hypothetical protein